jgi:hypothetical protein
LDGFCAAARGEDVCQARDGGVVGGLIERPDVGEDEARQAAVGHLFQDPAPELLHQPPERRRAERKELQHQVDGVVVVEEPEPRPARKLVSHRHLAHGGRSDDEDERGGGCLNHDRNGGLTARAGIY